MSVLPGNEPHEASGLWCAGGNVILDEIAEPPKPLKSRFVGGTLQHFIVVLDNIIV